MKQKTTMPNPAGKHGKPFTLAPHSFEDALRKILAAPPEPKSVKDKPERKSRKKAVKGK